MRADGHAGNSRRDRRGLVGHRAGRDALADPRREVLADDVEHVRLADEVAGDAGRRCRAGVAREVEQRGRASRRAPTPAGAVTSGELYEHALVEHPAGADGPAVVDVADAVAVGHAHVGHELLAELHRAVEHLDAVHLDAGLVDREDEHGEAAVLGHVPVGAGQAQAPVGPPRAGGPDLRAVERPTRRRRGPRW